MTATGVAGLWGLGRARVYFSSNEVKEANASALSVSESEQGLSPIPALGLFEGVADDVLLAPLRIGAISSVKFNRGGSSISLRVDFDNGSRAAFKPEQINTQTVPRREVAAYRVNRMLGLATVAPAIGRTFSAANLLAKLREDSLVFAPRIREEMITRGDRVLGELSWWIPEIKIARIGRYEIDSNDGVITWTRYLTIGTPIPQDERHLLEQLSRLVLFDFIIDNVDRWSGRNVFVSPNGRRLYSMDNTLSFRIKPTGSTRTRAYLYKVQRVSRSLVSAIEGLTRERVVAELTRNRGSFGELLTTDEITAMLGRRDFVLDYISQLISDHSRSAVMVFP